MCAQKCLEICDVTNLAYRKHKVSAAVVVLVVVVVVVVVVVGGGGGGSGDVGDGSSSLKTSKAVTNILSG